MLDIYRPYEWSDGPYLLYRQEWSKFMKSLTRRQKAAINSDRFTHQDTLKLLGIESHFNTNWRYWKADKTRDSAPGNESNTCGLRMMRWIQEHIGESKKKYAIKDAYRDRDKAKNAIKILEKMDTHSEYDRDDRVDASYLAELLGISMNELERLFKKYGDTSRSIAVYDDSCGIGGGHHTYAGWTTKIFTAVSFIKTILKMYDVQEVKS